MLLIVVFVLQRQFYFFKLYKYLEKHSVEKTVVI